MQEYNRPIFKSIDIKVSLKAAAKVLSISQSILRRESIVDIDIDTSKVSSIVIVSMSISIFDIHKPVRPN